MCMCVFVTQDALIELTQRGSKHQAFDETPDTEKSPSFELVLHRKGDGWKGSSVWITIEMR